MANGFFTASSASIATGGSEAIIRVNYPSNIWVNYPSPLSESTIGVAISSGPDAVSRLPAPARVTVLRLRHVLRL